MSHMSKACGRARDTGSDPHVGMVPLVAALAANLVDGNNHRIAQRPDFENTTHKGGESVALPFKQQPCSHSNGETDEEKEGDVEEELDAAFKKLQKTADKTEQQKPGSGTQVGHIPKTCNEPGAQELPNESVSKLRSHLLSVFYGPRLQKKGRIFELCPGSPDEDSLTCGQCHALTEQMVQCSSGTSHRCYRSHYSKSPGWQTEGTPALK